MSPLVRNTTRFYLLACALSWVLVIPLVAFGWSKNALATTLIGVGYMLMPAAAAVLMQKFVLRQPLAGPLGLRGNPNGWFIAAALVPHVISLLALAFSGLLPGVSFSVDIAANLAPLLEKLPPDQLEKAHAQLTRFPPVLLFAVQLGSAIGAGATINALAALGEELGWRGFLQRELAPLGFWRSSAVIGVLWGLWHAPLIALGHNYPEHPLIGIGMMVVFCVLLAPIIGWFRLRARSVLAAALFHGGINASAGFTLVYTLGGNDLIKGPTGLVGFAVLLAFNVALAVRGVADVEAELATIRSVAFPEKKRWTFFNPHA